ncbi:uncharacterized protein G2W53_032686 [Senna tora]|uniref:Uncharacterized protein n=1 Tax=Senna tora TaxID=362788 RepID=A0A834SZD2_9FABA|nr:uncharacterized protein G2W53_032686 [Senna tora]
MYGQSIARNRESKTLISNQKTELPPSAMAGAIVPFFKHDSWRENVESMFLNNPMPSISMDIGSNSQIFRRNI